MSPHSKEADPPGLVIVVLTFRCPHCQAPCTAPPELAGRKAKCLKCTQVLVIPNPERDRWPPGMEPPGLKQQAAPVVQRPTAPQPLASTPAANPVARPAAQAQAPAQPVLPAATDLPRAQPVPAAKPVVAAPAITGQPMASRGVPVARAVPVAPKASAAQAPMVAIPAVDDTVADDLGVLLDLERTAPALPTANALEVNPYRAPHTSESRADGSAPDEIRRIIYGETFTTAWQIFKSQAGSLIGATLCCTIVLALVFGMHQALLVGAMSILSLLEIRSPAVTYVVVIASLFALLAGITFVFLGYLRYVLLTARGKPAELNALFSTGPLTLPGMLVLLCTLLATAVGSLLIVGGLIAALLLVLAPVILVDQERGAINSIATSARIMSKNFLPGFLLLSTVGFVGNLLTLLTCGLGVFAVAPLLSLLWSVIYLRATGRRTAAD